MNYLLYQNAPTLRDHYLKAQETAPYIVLAWLTADDSLQPVEPPAGGLATERHEYARIPHRDKIIFGRYLSDLDPDPDKANLCCNQAFTGRIIPDKLILRSGWNPGDFFVLVELVAEKRVAALNVLVVSGIKLGRISTVMDGGARDCPGTLATRGFSLCLRSYPLHSISCIRG